MLKCALIGPWWDLGCLKDQNYDPAINLKPMLKSWQKENTQNNHENRTSKVQVLERALRALELFRALEFTQGKPLGTGFPSSAWRWVFELDLEIYQIRNS